MAQRQSTCCECIHFWAQSSATGSQSAYTQELQPSSTAPDGPQYKAVPTCSISTLQYLTKNMSRFDPCHMAETSACIAQQSNGEIRLPWPGKIHLSNTANPLPSCLTCLRFYRQALQPPSRMWHNLHKGLHLHT